MLQDLYGLDVSCNESAIEPWQKGLDASLTFDASGIAEMETAIAMDPNFALGHACLARQQFVHGFHEQANNSLEKALNLLGHSTPREKSQIRIMAAAAKGKADALSLALEHIDIWPLDIFVLAHIIGPFGLLAFSTSPDWRQDNVDLMTTLKHHWPEDDWWFLTSYAFALAEVGEVKTAQSYAERAINIRPTGNCAHSLSHVHCELGAFNEGTEFIEKWMKTDGQNSDMQHHLYWHKILFELEADSMTSESMEALYRTQLAPQVSDPMPLTTFSDNASILWRCLLNGIAIPENMVSDTKAYREKYFPKAGFAYADLHSIMTTAIMQSADEMSKLIQEYRALNNETMSDYLSKLAQGFFDFSECNYAQAANRLQPLVDKSSCLGGSNPQRQIVEDTFAEAVKRSG